MPGVLILQERTNLPPQELGQTRFGEEGVASCRSCARPREFHARQRHDRHVTCGAVLPQDLRGRPTIQARHREVHHNRVGSMVGRGGNSHEAVRGRPDRATDCAEIRSIDSARVGVIIDDENPRPPMRDTWRALGRSLRSHSSWGSPSIRVAAAGLCMIRMRSWTKNCEQRRLAATRLPHQKLIRCRVVSSVDRGGRLLVIERVAKDVLACFAPAMHERRLAGLADDARTMRSALGTEMRRGRSGHGEWRSKIYSVPERGNPAMFVGFTSRHASFRHMERYLL